MKKGIFFLFCFVSNLSFSQVIDNFSDNDFTHNPAWQGTDSTFIVNADLVLQSCAPAAGTQYLTTPSEAIDNAVWEFWVGIKYNTSSSNYAAVYLVSNTNDISGDIDGYYVQVGYTNDNVTLRKQKGSTKTTLIENEERKKILDTSDNSVYVRVTRDDAGNWALYSRLATETEFTLEGTAEDATIKTSSYVGLYVKNSSTTGDKYYFDDINFTGNAAKDTDPPTWTSLAMQSDNEMLLTFSEPISIENASYSLIETTEYEEIDILEESLSEDKTQLTLKISSTIEDNKLYELTLFNVTDLAGNVLDGISTRTIGILATPEVDKLAINEIMFNNPNESAEYVEIANMSDNLIDMTGLIVTTRKSDGSFNTGNIFPENSVIVPNGEIAITSDNILVAAYHNCPPRANIVSTKWSQTLNNDGTTIYLVSADYETVFDSVTYSAKWHHALIKNVKGVSLEKINPTMPSQEAASWHSASSECNYGTPGYQNSQYRELNQDIEENKVVWIEPEAFTPDGDGVEDICLIHYAMPENGYMATVSIYTPSGLLLSTIAENSLLATEGYVTWDGSTQAGKNANVGVYVLVFDVFNVVNGKKLKRKLPVVVGAR